MGQLFTTTAPAAEPLTLAEAKVHLRVEAGFTDDDALILSLIKAARQRIELTTSRALVTQTMRLVLAAFPSSGNGWTSLVRLPVCPVQAVTGIDYRDAAGQQVAWDAANWLFIPGEPPHVELAYGKYWPGHAQRSDAIGITFTAGFGDPAAVPEIAKAAMRLMIGHLYENREEVVTGTIASDLPRGAASLIDLLRWGDYR